MARSNSSTRCTTVLVSQLGICDQMPAYTVSSAATSTTGGGGSGGVALAGTGGGAVGAAAGAPGSGGGGPAAGGKALGGVIAGGVTAGGVFVVAAAPVGNEPALPEGRALFEDPLLEGAAGEIAPAAFPAGGNGGGAVPAPADGS